MHTLPRSAVRVNVVPVPTRRIEPQAADAVAPFESLEVEHDGVGFFVVGSMRLEATVKFDPASFSAVTDGVVRVSSVHEVVFDPLKVPLLPPPPRPVTEMTGLATGRENETVIVPRLVHNVP